MRHLHLRLCVTRLRTLKEDLQDQYRPVNHAYVRLALVIQRFLQIPDLPRREFVIEDHHIYRMMLSDILVYLFEFAFSDIGGGIGLVESLREPLDGHYAVRIR